MNDLSRVAGGVAPELKICRCGERNSLNARCSLDVGHEGEHTFKLLPADVSMPTADREAFDAGLVEHFVPDEWPFDDDPPDPL